MIFTMKLSKNEIRDRLKNLTGWNYDESKDMIIKDFNFRNFCEAMVFVLRVAFEAEKLDHHPNILIEYNRVRLSLRTHSENGVTDKDFKLVELIEKI